MIDVSNYGLIDWLSIIKKEKFDNIFPPSCCFPNDALRDEYLANVHLVDDADFRYLLRRFLIPNTSFLTDDFQRKYLINLPKRELIERIRKHEFTRRILINKNPWEGITWILDLLPEEVREAISVVDSYLTAHIGFLPDFRISGLCDSIEILRARYFSKEHPRETLLNMKPKEFEKIVKALYENLGYDAKLTKDSYDDGIDIVAHSDKPGKKEKIFIQCKRYNKDIGVEFLRNLLGVVNSEKATKGVLVCSSNFTHSAKKFADKNPNIELLDWNILCQLLNNEMGVDWPIKYHEIIRADENEKEHLTYKGC